MGDTHTHTHTHTHAHTHTRTHTGTDTHRCRHKQPHRHTQAGTHTHGNETACLLLAGEKQTSLSRRGTRAPVSLDRLLHQRRSSSVMTTNYHRSSGRKGSPSNRDPRREEEVDRFWCTWSKSRSLQHGYWAAKKDQGHNFFLILAILDFGHSADCWDSGDGPKMWAHEQWRNSEKIRLLLPPIREPLRYTPPRLHPICARSDRVSLVFLPPTRCTRHGVRYAKSGS